MKTIEFIGLSGNNIRVFNNFAADVLKAIKKIDENFASQVRINFVPGYYSGGGDEVCVRVYTDEPADVEVVKQAIQTSDFFSRKVTLYFGWVRTYDKGLVAVE